SICLDGIHPWDYQKAFSNVSLNDGYSIHISMTNDSWYGPTIERFQHLNLLSLRAIELRTPIVRVTNDGISALILKDGKTYQETKVNEEANPTYAVPLSKRERTIFEQYGFQLYLILIGIIFLLHLFD